MVGSDSRADLTPQQQAELSTGGDLGNGRTDTILVVHIPGLGSGEPTTMVSIPRDSYVDIPGYGTDKINAAFAEGGAALLAQTVELATGLRLDHYAEIGFAGFGALVDALGGVQVCPDRTDRRPAGRDRPAGRLSDRSTGPTALGYVRSRATARGRIWTGWSINESSCRRCCIVPPVRGCGSIRGTGTRFRTQRWPR